MNTETLRKPACLTAALLLALAGPSSSIGQILSPPIAAPSASGTAAPGVGSGRGFHDPRSAFKPLQDRDGIVSWHVLSAVTTKPINNRIAPTFPPSVQALNQQKVKVQGFMMPLEPGDKQRHFLLSAVPTTCAFCVPAGPEGLIEVRARVAVKYSVEAVVVEGRMAVLNDDPYGLFYRITDGELVP